MWGGCLNLCYTFVMSRFKLENQIIYNDKLELFLKEYKALRKSKGKIDTKNLIIKYNITSNSKFINNKQLYKILARKRVLSQNEWKKEIIEKYFKYLQSKSFKRSDIVKIIDCKLNIGKSAINERLRGLGYGNKKLSKTLEKSIISDYNNNIDIEILLKKYNTKKHILKQILVSNHIDISHMRNNSNSLYEYRDLYEINLLNAHLIGLIWADGSISSGTQVNIGLQIDDEEYLQKIVETLFLNNNLSTLTKVDRRNSQNRKSNKDTVVLCIARKKYVDFLRKEGLSLNKERNEIKLPKFLKNASNEIFLSFLKGFFEGDGHLTYSKKMPSLGFSVTKKLGEELKEQLLIRFRIKSNLVKDKTIFRLSIGGVAPVFYLLIQIYRILADIYMSRKFIKAQNIWEIFLPNYLISVMPLFNQKYLLNTNLSNDALKLLSQMFSTETQKIHIQNTITKENFKGTKDEFLKLHPEIKSPLLNRVINGSRKSTNNWILVEKPKQRFLLSINKKYMEQIIHLENKKSNIKYSGKLIDFLDKYYYELEYIKELLNGLVKSYKDWYINYYLVEEKIIYNNFCNTLKKNSSFYQNNISMIKKDTNEIFKGKEIDFMITYYIPPRYLKRVLNKTRNQVNGWFLKKDN